MDASETRRDAEPAFDPAAHGWRELPRDDGFITLVGPFWRRLDDPRRFGFRAEPRHDNINGVVQGGMLMTFADRSLGYLSFEAAGGRTATAAFDMNFVSGGRIGSFIEIACEVVRTTRSLVFLRGTLTGGGDVVAICQGTWKILGR